MAAFRSALARLSNLMTRQRGTHSRFVFAVPVKPRRATTQWDVVSSNLARTIRSIQAARNESFQVFLCGHENPCPRLADSRFTFVRATFAYGEECHEGSKDKARKLVLIGSTLRKMGYDDFYTMFLDADDLVHKDLVEHVLATDNRRSYVISQGYVYDDVTGRMALRENAFDRACGSSFICWFETRDLPRHDSDRECFFGEFVPHTRRGETAGLKGRAPDVVPFPAAVYWLNHAESLQRLRAGGAMRKVAPRSLLDVATTREILNRDFLSS